MPRFVTLADLKKITGWLLIILFVAAPALWAQNATWADDVESGCTSIMAGKSATIDGSVITCHSCDGNYRTWLNIVPRQTHEKGAMRKIRWGTMHTETLWDLRGIIEKGEIPQVSETYAFMNVAYPCMNEKGLAIGETTIGGRPELVNDDGLFVIEELEAIVLERCTTAREAIKLIGKLVSEYGYGDRGECITIADAKEVWHFEIFGAGPLEVSSVWAARRIPDDHVGVSANKPKIGELDLNDPDHFMASDNVYRIAEEMGWYDPDSNEPFKFWKAYSNRPQFGIREFYVLSTMAPSLNLSLDAEEIPFSVKPDKKVSVRDVMRYYRETYEGTEYQSTKNLVAPEVPRNWWQAQTDEKSKIVMSPAVNPWMSREMQVLLNYLKPGVLGDHRGIASAGCSYSQIIQCRDWLPPEIGTVAWFSFDNPALSPRIPIFAGVLSLPKSFEICSQHRFRTDAASWHFRRANRLATVKWGYAREHIEGAIATLEERAFTELPLVEQKALELKANKDHPDLYRRYLTGYANDFARAAMNRWWELGDTFWTMFARGF